MKVDGAAGPLALGAKGSVRDRLTPPGRVEGFRPREVYSIAALARWAPSAPVCIKPYNRPAGEEMHSPFGGWRHHLAPVGSMSLDSRVAALPYESSSFATPAKAVGLWMLSHGAMSLQKSMEPFILSPGWGKVRRSRIRGGSRAAANYQNAFHDV